MHTPWAPSVLIVSRMQSFRSFPSLYQHPPGGRRTKSQQAGFDRALEVMGDLYASVVGTTVLMSKEIPLRPPEFDGVLGLYDLAEDVDATSIRAAFAEFGDIVWIEIGGHPDARVRFSTPAVLPTTALLVSMSASDTAP